jgi:hypothetical protein
MECTIKVSLGSILVADRKIRQIASGQIASPEGTTGLSAPSDDYH